MSRTLDQLERALKASNERVARAVRALAPKHKGGEMEEFQAAVDEHLRLEREVALAKGEETAVVIEWKPQWDIGAPLPHVLSSEGRTFLIYMSTQLQKGAVRENTAAGKLFSTARGGGPPANQSENW